MEFKYRDKVEKLFSESDGGKKSSGFMRRMIFLCAILFLLLAVFICRVVWFMFF